MPINPIALNDDVMVGQEKIYQKLVIHNDLLKKIQTLFLKSISHCLFNTGLLTTHKPEGIADTGMIFAAITSFILTGRKSLEFLAAVFAPFQYFRFPFGIIFASMLVRCTNISTLLGTIFLIAGNRRSYTKQFPTLFTLQCYQFAVFVNLLIAAMLPIALIGAVQVRFSVSRCQEIISAHYAYNRNTRCFSTFLRAKNVFTYLGSWALHQLTTSGTWLRFHDISLAGLAFEGVDRLQGKPFARVITPC